jgi:uroporphyrinogen-III synthase
MKNGRVLVIREFGDFSAVLISNGCEVINFPTIVAAEAEDLSELKKNIKAIKEYDGIFFTSPKAAEVFLKIFDEDYFGKIYVLGNRLKSLFENKSFDVVSKDNVNTVAEFVNSFDRSEFVGKKFLFLKSSKSLRVIPEMLADIAEIDETCVYETRLFKAEKEFVESIGQKFSQEAIDFICFFSPSGIENFLNIFKDFEQQKIRIAAIGTTTAERIKELGFEVDFTASDAKKFASEFCMFFR